MMARLLPWLCCLALIGCGNGAAAPDGAEGGPVVLKPVPNKRFVNSVGMTLLPVQPGTFQMGSPPDEEGRDKRFEWPVHRVTLTRGFWMSAHEVTNAQYRQFRPQHSTKELSGEFYKGEDEDDRPVVMVSWFDAVAFCKWLSEKEGCTYRLPTEAEWEYACRAGTRTPYYFGADAKQLGVYEWYRFNSGVHTHPVGQKRPNPWGFYDMLGNAAEWLLDYHGRPEYFRSASASDPAVDPKGPTARSDISFIYMKPRRVMRSGSCKQPPEVCRAAGSVGNSEERTWPGVSFRVVVEGMPKDPSLWREIAGPSTQAAGSQPGE